MIGLDTNILVRYLTQDDAAQSQAVMRLLHKKGAVFFVADVVLVEVDWVLSSTYGWTRLEIAETFARLLTIQNLTFENEPRLRTMLKSVRLGADLSDALIAALCEESGCSALATFDKGLLKHFPKLAFAPK